MFKPGYHHLAPLALVCASLLLTGCESEDAHTTSFTGECSLENQLDYVRDLYRYEYLYNDEVAARIENQHADSVEALVYALRYEPYDTYTYINSIADYNDSQSHESFLYGFHWTFSDNGEYLIVRSIADGSPTQAAGLVRGDKILEIAGTSVADIYTDLGLGNSEFTDFIGPSDSSEPVLFKWQTIEGDIIEKEIARDTFIYNKVSHLSYLETNSGTAAYFVYEEFSRESEQELEDTFRAIKRQDPEHLIIDLRYNPGGLIYVSNILASAIAGDKIANKTYVNYHYNSLYIDDSIPFDHLTAADYALNMSKVYFLTTDSSCSASELVINNLSPYMDVEVIGETTCGKPLGSFGREFCDSVLHLIEFEFSNANGEGGYHNGLTPSCYAEDRPEYPFGDPRDNQLARALSLIDGEECPAQPTFNRRKPTFTEIAKPYTLTNANYRIEGKPSRIW